MGEVDKLRIALDTFCSTKTDDLVTDNIPDDLEKILEQIARNGELPLSLEWKQVSYVVRRKILYCIHEMNIQKKYTGSAEEYTETMDLILSQVEHFEVAPFTIQRVAELLIEPRKHYTNTDKYMRALLKNLLVVSGWRKQPESDLPDATSEAKKEIPAETKIEPDSTSEGVSFGNSSNSSPRRSPDQSDSSQTQIQPADSTTADATKDEPEVKAEPTVKNEVKNEPTDEISQAAEEDNFVERPKSKPSEEDEMDVFDSMKKTSPKRKVALSSSKIQIQVGVGKGIPPAAETAETSEPVSSTNSEAMEVAVDEPPAAEESTKPDEGGKEEEVKKEPLEERKRKRSADSAENNATETGNAASATGTPTPDDATDSTPQKLQKTE